MDRTYILEEFKKDALIYSLTVTDNAIDMLLNDRTYDSILNYLSVKHLEFSKFKGVSFAEDIIVLNEDFFKQKTRDEQVLDEFYDNISEISSNAEKSIEGHNSIILKSEVTIISAFVVILIVWQILGMLQKRKEKKEKEYVENK